MSKIRFRGTHGSVSPNEVRSHAIALIEEAKRFPVRPSPVRPSVTTPEMPLEATTSNPPPSKVDTLATTYYSQPPGIRGPKTCYNDAKLAEENPNPRFQEMIKKAAAQAADASPTR